MPSIRSISYVLAITFLFWNLFNLTSNETVNSEMKAEKTNTQEIINVDIGEVIAEDKGIFILFYGGLMNDSLLFNVFHDKAEVESSMLFSIPKTRMTPFTFPSFPKHTFEIDSINSETGEIKLIITTEM